MHARVQHGTDRGMLIAKLDGGGDDDDEIFPLDRRHSESERRECAESSSRRSRRMAALFTCVCVCLYLVISRKLSIKVIYTHVRSLMLSAANVVCAQHL